MGSNSLSQENKPQPKVSLIELSTWPPRFYTCGFCKRQFRSAQALGGHMNVHRRDRARLRQSPTHPYNSFLSLSSAPLPSRFPSLLLSLSTSTTSSSASTDLRFSHVKGTKSDGGFGIWNKGKNFVRMDMENSSNDIDLELRLGF